MMRLIQAVIVAAACLAATPEAGAALVVEVRPAGPVVPGSGGNFFDVVLVNTGAGPLDLEAFNVTLSADPGVSFRGATDETSAPYVFAGNNADFGGLSFNLLAPGLIDVNDIADDPTGAIPAEGEVGLGRVFFDYEGPLGEFEISAVGPTSLTGLGSEPLQFTAVSGTFTAVPEPAGSALMGLAGALMAGSSLRRRLRGRG